MNLEERLKETAQLIIQRRNVVAFSGAGVSAESGVSTYRDKGGLWDRYPEGSSSGILGVLANHPEDAPKILSQFLSSFKNSKPNPGHLALAQLEQLGFLTHVITQNVDGLHKEAGNSIVYELHGSLYRRRCLSCGKKEQITKEELINSFEQRLERISQQVGSGFALGPQCSCGGNTRGDFVSFGESVQDLPEAMDAAQNCNLMLVLGTSGVVYPAASLPRIAKNKGAVLIEINPKESDLTPLMDIFIQGKSGELLPRVIDIIKESIN
ncbi:MAG: Sir2 family NAD-dependent protein deacetylase [Thermodesulfobacteriota bacterium]|nr:Sir2 family NAD-dependent protein deacetylase [Thermodesulfobacteriota bacterium]